MAISYNTAGIACLTISLILLLNNDNKVELIISGILYAAAVLCCPFLALTYIAYSFYILYQKIIKKENAFFYAWLMFTVGVSILAILFLLFVFSRISFRQFLDSIGFVLSDETSHPSRSLVQIILEYINETVFFTDYSTILIGGLFITAALNRFDKKRKERQDLYYMAFILLGTLYLSHMFLVDGHINYLMFPVSLTGFFVLLCVGQEKAKRFMWCYMVPAFLYTLYLSMTSNTKTYAITSASSVMLVLSIIIICKYAEKMNKDGLVRKGIAILVTVMMLMQVSYLSYAKATVVFPKQEVTDLVYHIEEGPFKGTNVDERTYNMYLSAYEEVDEIRRDHKERSIVFFSPYNWLYLLASDFSIASPSSWYTADPKQIGLLEDMNEYYKVNKAKQPELIYVEEGFEDIVSSLDIIDNYSLAKTSFGKILYVRNK